MLRNSLGKASEKFLNKVATIKKRCTYPNGFPSKKPPCADIICARVFRRLSRIVASSLGKIAIF